MEPTVYKQDQNIVVKGDRVSEEQMAVLESLGLLQGNSFDAPLYVGAAVTVLLILAVAYLFAYMFVPHLFTIGASALVLLIAGVLTVMLSLLLGAYVSVDAMPVVLGAMLVVNLMGARPAYVINMTLALLITFLTFKGTNLDTSEMLSVLMMTFAGSTLAIFLLRKNASRVFVLVTGLLVGVVNFVVLLCVGALTSSDIGNLFSDASHAILLGARGRAVRGPSADSGSDV